MPPYVSKWMTVHEAVAEVCRLEGLSSAAARRQVIKWALDDDPHRRIWGSDLNKDPWKGWINRTLFRKQWPEDSSIAAIENATPEVTETHKKPHETSLPTPKSPTKGTRKGRPTKGWPLIKQECRDRFANGERHATTAEWARTLLTWFAREHPGSETLKESSLRNNLRKLLPKLKSEAAQKAAQNLILCTKHNNVA
jgi:hypothetical protein